jgi:CO/xanthine dehydrogenase Mo-binding subunit
MVVAEELGVPLERIRIDHADTLSTPYAPGSGGSQTVLVNAPAVRAAAADVKRQLLALAAEELKQPVERLRLAGGKVVSLDDPKAGVAIGDLKSLQERQNLLGLAASRCWRGAAVRRAIAEVRSTCDRRGAAVALAGRA